MPDLVLESLLGRLETSMESLRETSERQDWPSHYEAALEFDRVCRNIRFAIGDPSAIRAEERGRFAAALHEVKRRINTQGAEGNLPAEHFHMLMKIRGNARHRMGWLKDILSQDVEQREGR